MIATTSAATTPGMDELLGDAGYEALKVYVIEATGHTYYANKDADLARRLALRLTARRASNCSSYLQMLRDPQSGAAELEALAQEITIGESFFFRHCEHFDALGSIVLPNVITRNAAMRWLRVWCAGCADGAEPYSLSILMRRELGSQLAGWDTRILATDINRHSLAAAAEGQFEEWSFRSSPDELRRECFSQLGKTWRVAPAYRAGISFQHHNLVQDPFPPPHSPGPFDLIICRNVMIYFGTELMRTLVQRFHQCLAPGGWLLVGPSEPNMTCFTNFRTVNAPGVTLFQKPLSRDERDEDAEGESPYVPASFAPLESAPVYIPLKPWLCDVPSLQDLRAHIEGKRWEDAAQCCRQLLDTNNLDPVVHLHHALILERLGRFADAEKSLRRALYLDRNSALAHYRLGLLLESRGDGRQAARCFSNALAMLSERAGDESLPDPDGMTVAELRSSARMRAAREDR